MPGDLSLPLTGLLLLAIMAAAYLIGRTLPKLRAGGPSAPDNPVLSGVFGLLALLMAFALSLAIGRYEERRELVVTEANAIGTMATRLALLPPERASAMMRALANYATIRVAAGQEADDTAWEAQSAQGGVRCTQFGDALFSVVRSAPADTRTPLLVQAYNDMCDTATMRHAARQAHLPGEVLALLGLYCVAAAGVLGSAHAALPARASAGAALLLALLGAAFVVILDLDQPRSGAIIVPQDELEAIANQLQTRPQ